MQHFFQGCYQKQIAIHFCRKKRGRSPPCSGPARAEARQTSRERCGRHSAPWPACSKPYQWLLLRHEGQARRHYREERKCAVSYEINMLRASAACEETCPAAVYRRPINGPTRFERDEFITAKTGWWTRDAGQPLGAAFSSRRADRQAARSWRNHNTNEVVSI
jgi:hypothetical protein